MGFKRAKTYLLKWPEDHEMHGLEVETKGMSVERMLSMSRLAATLVQSDGMTEKLDTASKLFEQFAHCLVSWNLEDEDGKPVPTTYDGVASQDLSFVMDLVNTWMEAVASVGTPLPEPSPNGASSETRSPAMESLLQGASSPSPLS